MSTGPQRNWRGILIALLVIAVVLALIVTSVALLTPPDQGPRVRGHRLRLHDILDREFTPLRFNGTWISGELRYCRESFITAITILAYINYSLNINFDISAWDTNKNHVIK